MSIEIGLDFGSLSYRAAYVAGDEIIPVPMPSEVGDGLTWRGLVFMETDPNVMPAGFTFSSLKYQLGGGKPFAWRGATQTPEDVVKDIFANIKRAVETYSGEEIGRAVIAVPAQYSALRRSIVRELGEAAGFGQVDLINDCTGAALGHIHEQEEAARTLLLYSMGFYGYEVSLVRYARQRFRELGHEGAKTPSGRDFDMQTMVAAVEALQAKGVQLPMRAFTGQWFDFRYLASDLKERLTTEDEATLELPPYITGTDARGVRFRRVTFERAIAKQVEATLTAVQRALDDAGLRPQDIDQVVLVGGSTRIGVIQRRLEELFGDKLAQPRDDLLARGAAIQAHRLAKGGDEKEGAAPRTEPSLPVKPPPTAQTTAEQRPAAVAPPPPPDIEPIFEYARLRAASGERAAAVAFLEGLESQSRAVREQLAEK
jgi:molecular chaperone DnaK